ncbi:hypothetical protein BDK61_3579 [Haloarcula quadrata]|uniref:Small CPxCG-related zinc finger protein n=3 Tax=Haloarcula TaxID=2237 RepID=Q5UXY4_HALMA|nr:MULTISPECIES: DUF6276 family protein [Haloarcula]AAV47869.1 unknown [Haloarcula marismortui ATCC 43049]EMA17692.1 hypothetical protein C435_11069 [Haloarcula californiae ATCC 33799]QCP92547.1 hypothetical protein E6P14_17405 [Haloarcula marismortui ATCC 43049]RKS84178.1 hypothetical protein BDK61_3579 [Haloarcula quadrata]
MSCPDCGGDLVSFPVPDDLQQLLPGNEPGAGVCRSCLALHPETEPPAAVPDLSDLDGAIPDADGAAVPLVLLVGLLDSLAMHREEITALLERVEREGVDPLLVLDRLDASYGEAAHVDLGRRRRQLEQLL